MQSEKILLATTVLAVAALSRMRLVNFAGGTCGAGARPLGVANAAYDSGEQAGVNTHGELLVEAGAAVAVGDEVQSDAQGRAITKAAGIGWGVARDAAAAAGDYIRVLR